MPVLFTTQQGHNRLLMFEPLSEVEVGLPLNLNSTKKHQDEILEGSLIFRLHRINLLVLYSVTTLMGVIHICRL